MRMRESKEYKELMAAFHHLWTKYTHEAGYDKQEWKRLGIAVERMVDKARERVFDEADEFGITEEDERRVLQLLRQGRELRESMRDVTSKLRGSRKGESLWDHLRGD